MKKILLGTTAAAAGMALAGPALSAELSWGGRAMVDVYALKGGPGFYASGDYTEFGTGYRLNLEPSFKASGSGINFKVNSRIEGMSNTAAGTNVTTDRLWLTVGNSDMGHIRAGRGEIAAGQYQTAGQPRTPFHYYWGAQFGEGIFGNGALFNSDGAYQQFNTNAISYTTPTFSGFKAAVSASGFADDSTNEETDFNTGIGASYDTELGFGSLGVSASYTAYDESKADISGDSFGAIQLGANVNTGDFWVGGDIAQDKSDRDGFGNFSPTYSHNSDDEWAYTFNGVYTASDKVAGLVGVSGNTGDADIDSTALYLGAEIRPAANYDVVVVPDVMIQENRTGAKVRTALNF